MITKSTSNQNNKKQNFKSLLLTLVAVMLCTTGFAQWNNWCYKDFTANGSFTPPAGCDEIYIEAIGGGGGGGNADQPSSSILSSNARVGTGGGGGGYARKHVANPSGNYTIIIGAGGAAAQAGGNTTVTGTGCNISANGGGAGTNSSNFSGNNVNTSGAGGTATGGDVALPCARAPCRSCLWRWPWRLWL